MSKRIVVTQSTYSDRWIAEVFRASGPPNEYELTEASGNRLMGICNDDGDIDVFHFVENGSMGLEIYQHG
jgi:hypothetical protein